MHRSAFLSLPAGRLARAAPAAAGLALLAAVVSAGQASAAPAALPANCTQSGSTVTCTYSYTGAEQTFTVPPGVSSVQITVVGAPGASGGDATEVPPGTGGPGGAGGTASATVTPPASTLYVEVGGLGNGTAGGWNGGAAAGALGVPTLGDPGDAAGGGGGGASDVRTASCGTGCATGGSTGSLNSRLVVGAGGGGGGGAGDIAAAGAGGPAGGPGTQGQPGADSLNPGGIGGGAGTSAQGGAGGAGAAGAPGTLMTRSPGGAGLDGMSGQGGTGGDGGVLTDSIGSTPFGGGGGGAGGGYFGGGGGGGGSASPGGGGGGGSSFAPGGSTGTDTTGTASVTISYTSSNTVTVTNPGNQTSTVGTAVSLQIGATDSASGQTLTYSATGLPAGLSINSSTGLISGTPTRAGTSSVTVTATDTTGASGSASFTWTVNPLSNTVTVTNPGNQTSTVGTAVSLQIGATDSASGQTLTYSATGLPAGLSINSSTGLISGTPTSAGTSSVTVTATDTTGASGSASFTWTVTPAPLEVTTTSLPGATLGSAYSATLAATGGTPPYSWSVSAGSLPPGLSLSSSGTISGTPAEAGTYSLTIQAADSSSPRQTATAQLSITVGGCTTSITGSHTGQIVVGKGQFVCIGPDASQNGAITVNSGGGLSVVSSTLTGGISTGGAVSLGLSGSKINGSVSLTNDNGPSVVSGNTIGGSLACSGNNPPPVDNGQANKVSGKSSGQCSALG